MGHRVRHLIGGRFFFLLSYSDIGFSRIQTLPGTKIKDRLGNGGSDIEIAQRTNQSGRLEARNRNAKSEGFQITGEIGFSNRRVSVRKQRSFDGIFASLGSQLCLPQNLKFCIAVRCQGHFHSFLQSKWGNTLAP